VDALAGNVYVPQDRPVVAPQPAGVLTLPFPAIANPAVCTVAVPEALGSLNVAFTAMVVLVAPQADPCAICNT
jgi:hypothetical protein